MVPSKWSATGRLAVFLALLAALLSPGGASPSPSASLDDLDLDDLNLDDPRLDEGLGAVGAGEQSQPHREGVEVEDQEEEHVGEVMLSPHAEPTVAQKETDVYRLVSSAMRQPSLRRQLSQILPIVRAMTPAQRLALAAMLSQAAAGRSSAVPLARSPASPAQQLLLPLSWDIAHLITDSAPQADGGRLHRSPHQVVETPQAQQLRRRMGVGPSSFRRSPPPPSLTMPMPPPLDLSPPPGNNRRNALVTTDIQPPPPPKKHQLQTPPPPPPAPHDLPPTPDTREQHQQHPPTTFRPSPARPQHRLEPADSDAELQECNLVGNDMCLDTEDYPDSAILASIRRSQGSMDAMLLDSGQRATSPPPTADRRPGSPTASALTSSQASESGGSLCASRTQLARPRRARATSGHWKFVVNVGEYTQTLRLDLCLKPGDSCSLLPDTVESRCQQVYNYHRLLTWDNERGLHMDIFKVPTCCTCQVTAVHPLLQRTTRPQASSKHHDLDSDADAAAAADVPSRLPPITTSTQTAATTAATNFAPTRPSWRRPAAPPVTGSPGFLPPRGPPLPLADHGGADVDSRLSWLKRNRSSLYNRYPPRRPKPHVISSDSIRRGSTRQPTPPPLPTLPTPPDSATPSPDGLSGGVHGPHRRVNYSYHPIMDYIRQQQLAEHPQAALQSRSGQGWTPMEGPAAA